MADINKDNVLRSLTAAIQVQTLKIADEPKRRQVSERAFHLNKCPENKVNKERGVFK